MSRNDRESGSAPWPVARMLAQRYGLVHVEQGSTADLQTWGHAGHLVLLQRMVATDRGVRAERCLLWCESTLRGWRPRPLDKRGRTLLRGSARCLRRSVCALAEFPQLVSVGQKTRIVGDLVCLTRIRAGLAAVRLFMAAGFLVPTIVPTIVPTKNVGSNDTSVQGVCSAPACFCWICWGFEPFWDFLERPVRIYLLVASPE